MIFYIRIGCIPHISCEHRTNLAFDQWVRYNDHTEVWYASGQSVAAMHREISKAKPAVLFVIGIYSWYYNLLPLLLGKVPVKIISVRGMLHAGALSQKSLKKKIYLAVWKLAGIHRRYAFHATDLTEQGFIRQIFGEQIANGEEDHRHHDHQDASRELMPR